jgi:sugar lactone lactonase YvrE
MTRQPESHDEAPLDPCRATIIATWPEGSFLENIALLADGDFVISVHNKAELHRVDLTGATSLFAAMPAPPAGLVAADDGVFCVAGEPGVGPHRLFKVAANGTVTEILTIPDTLFLNGFTPGRAGLAYTVDSILGVVIEIDLAAAMSRIVLSDERLTKCSDAPMLPGANGIKFGDDGLYITNTDRALVLRARFADGVLGPLGGVAEHLRGDDFALDRAGNLYITNHIHNTLIRLGANGARTAIAGPDQFMAGSTACSFHPDHPGSLFVTTTGGMIMPLDGVVQPAKLVRLEVGATGRIIGFGNPGQ